MMRLLLVVYIAITWLLPIAWMLFVRVMVTGKIHFRIKPMFAWYDL
jgi:hypothetical protein